MSDRTADWFTFFTAPIEAARTTIAFGEAAVQAQSVIAARLPILVDAIKNPRRANRRELTLMVTEKLGAAKGSARSATASAKKMQSAISGHAETLGRIGGGELPTAEMWLGTAERNLSIAAALITLPGEMFRPFQRRIAANAKRLG